MQVELAVNKSNRYYNKTYARGFLISDSEYTVHDNWTNIKIGNKFLTFDPCNRYGEYLERNKFVAILGTVIDPLFDSEDNEKISKRLFQFLEKENEFYEQCDNLCGRYILLYGKSNDPKIIQDAVGMRSVFYSTTENLVSSHYNLIHDIIGTDAIPYWTQYVHLKKKPWILPGNFTPWKDIKVLTPNHVLYLNTRTVKRFWPRSEIKTGKIEDSYLEIERLLKKQVDILYKDHQVALSLTGGFDSRLTSSLVRRYKDSTFFFTYTSENDSMMSEDAAATKKLSKVMNVPIHYFDLDKVDVSSKDFKDLREVCEANHYHQNVRKAIPYYLNDIEKGTIHLRSNLIEIVRKLDMYEALPTKATADDLVDRLYPMDKDNELVRKMFKSYYEDNEFDNIYDYQTADIIFWEYRLGIWANTSMLAEGDIAFETYQLFNCRRILELGLSVPRYYKQNNYLAYWLVKRNWPEMYLNVPHSEFTLYDKCELDKSPETLPWINHFEYSEPDGLYFTRFSEHNAELSFSQPSIHKGEIVGIGFGLAVDPNSFYSIELDVTIPTDCKIPPGTVGYSINLNGDEIYKTDAGDYYQHTNCINILHPSKTNDFCVINVELVSKKDYKSYKGSAGTIIIKSLYIRKLPAKNISRTIVTSSKDGFNKAIYLAENTN